MAASGGGGTNFYIKGLVSSDTMGKVAKKLSRQVQTGRARLVASNTHKITAAWLVPPPQCDSINRMANMKGKSTKIVHMCVTMRPEASRIHLAR
jgi:citrate lyase alpha subunit